MFTLQLNEQQMNVVGQALGELPFKISAPVIQAINAQLQAAQQEPTVPDGEAVEKE